VILPVGLGTAFTGTKDLRAMGRGTMDSSGRTPTQFGRVVSLAAGMAITIPAMAIVVVSSVGEAERVRQAEKARVQAELEADVAQERWLRAHPKAREGLRSDPIPQEQPEVTIAGAEGDAQSKADGPRLQRLRALLSEIAALCEETPAQIAAVTVKTLRELKATPGGGSPDAYTLMSGLRDVIFATPKGSWSKSVPADPEDLRASVYHEQISHGTAREKARRLADEAANSPHFLRPSFADFAAWYLRCRDSLDHEAALECLAAYVK
jgi:hypothetical protein